MNKPKVEPTQPDIEEAKPSDYLTEWRSRYPSISELLADLECPLARRQMAKTSRIAQLIEEWLDRWQRLGRPQLDWPSTFEPK